MIISLFSMQFRGIRDVLNQIGWGIRIKRRTLCRSGHDADCFEVVEFGKPQYKTTPGLQHRFTWSRHDTFPIASPFGRKSPVPGGYPSQRVINVEPWRFVFVILAWISCWTYNRIASDLRGSCDLTVMSLIFPFPRRFIIDGYHE